MIILFSIIPLLLFYFIYFNYFLLFIFIPITKINLSFTPYKYIKNIINISNTEFIFPINTTKNYILPSLQISYSIQDYNYILMYYIIIISFIILMPFIIIQIIMYFKSSFYKHEMSYIIAFSIFLFFLQLGPIEVVLCYEPPAMDVP